MPGHRKTAAATRLTANRSLSAPPARVSITKRNRNSSRTARTRPRRGLHDVTASQSLHAAIPQKRLITERQWVHRSARGVITNIEKKREYVYHYSFHIMDPAFGHLTIKMSGHPPFGAQVMLNGHEYVAVAAQDEGIGFTKEGNCFTEIADPQRLARVADAWPRDAAIGRLGQVCDRWIYSACLCFGLDTGEQQASGFRYAYSVYQAEYSRNLLFRSGARMDRVFGTVADRTRSRLDVPALRTLFGLKTRPHHNRKHGPPAQDIVIEKPQYGLSWFRIRFGRLQLKAYTKGEHVLRFEATVHNAKELRCRRSLDTSPRSSPCSPGWRTGSPPR